MRQPTFFSLALPIYDHQEYASFASGYNSRNESTKPAASSSENFPLSSYENPALPMFGFAFLMSMRLCATFMSPHTITGFVSCSLSRYARNLSSNAMRKSMRTSSF